MTRTRAIPQSVLTITICPNVSGPPLGHKQPLNPTLCQKGQGALLLSLSTAEAFQQSHPHWFLWLGGRALR